MQYLILAEAGEGIISFLRENMFITERHWLEKFGAKKC